MFVFSFAGCLKNSPYKLFICRLGTTCLFISIAALSNSVILRAGPSLSHHGSPSAIATFHHQIMKLYPCLFSAHWRAPWIVPITGICAIVFLIFNHNCGDCSYTCPSSCPASCPTSCPPECHRSACPSSDGKSSTCDVIVPSRVPPIIVP